MDIKTLLDKERIEVVADEAEIQTVIRKAKAAFMESESQQLLSYNGKRDILYTPGNGSFCRLVCDYFDPGIMEKFDKPLYGS